MLEEARFDKSMLQALFCPFLLVGIWASLKFSEPKFSHN